MIIKEGKSNVEYLLIVFVLAIVVGGVTLWQYSEMQKEETTIPEIKLPEEETDGKNCTAADDCVVFGKDGDCNCGCFNKDYSSWQSGGTCFCAAPTSCECTNGKCEGVFEETVDWKTKYGFEIQYPPEAEEKKKGMVMYPSIQLENPFFRIDRLEFEFGRKEVLTKQISTRSEEELNRLLDCDLPNPDFPSPPLTKKKVAINGLEFCLLSFTEHAMAGERAKHYLYSQKKDNDYLLLDFFVFYKILNYPPEPEVSFEESEEGKEIQSIINQTLSTFKFLD